MPGAGDRIPRGYQGGASRGDSVRGQAGGPMIRVKPTVLHPQPQTLRLKTRSPNTPNPTILNPKPKSRNLEGSHFEAESLAALSPKSQPAGGGAQDRIHREGGGSASDHLRGPRRRPRP